MDEKLDINKIASDYNDMEKIWDINDKWHYQTYRTIERFIIKSVKKYHISKSSAIINLGSGGNPYCFDEANMLHVDIAKNNIVTKNKFLISNIEKIDVRDATYSCCLCVGSVINYCDAALAIKETKRILKDKSYLFLEFESSRSFEFIKTKNYNKMTTMINTFYCENTIKIWAYSEDYISQLLKINGFKIIALKRFHIISPLIYRLKSNSNFASKYFLMDTIFRYVPFFRKHSSNIILLAQKTG
jgi:hypothetical protein